METWITLVSFGLFLIVMTFWLVYRTSTRKELLIQQVIIEEDDHKIMFFDERDRLIYCSPGLILFEKNRGNRSDILPEKPMLDQTVRGEIELDHNRYRYAAKSMEYSPGKTGLMVRLIYLSSASAS